MVLPKITPSSAGILAPPVTDEFLGPTQVHTKNGTSVGLAAFVGLMFLSSGQTYKQPTEHR